MITQELLTYPVVPKEYLFPRTIEEFLDAFEGILDLDIEKGMELDFEVEGRNNDKISPMLKLARPKDAKEIAKVCKEVYKNSYPYKQIEDPSFVKKMIKSPEHHFILFMVDDFVAGCFRCAIDFKSKKGYMGGFMLREQFHKNLDVIKAIMGSYYWMWSRFRKDVVVWYCENRTAHAASQYITAVCGINTIAIFPNKDIFYGEIESDVMGIVYSEEALSKYRSKKIPSLVENSVDAFLHSDNLYQLGFFRLVSPHLNLDIDKIERLREKVKITFEEDKHGYQHFLIQIDDSKSYFSFLHTPTIQNFEKADYHVENCEEMHVFLEVLQKCMRANDIRYCEIFIPAYLPEYQALLLNFGFEARGYAPCWKYNEAEGLYEDHVIFNWFSGGISNIELLPQGWELYKMLFNEKNRNFA